MGILLALIAFFGYETWDIGSTFKEHKREMAEIASRGEKIVESLENEKKAFALIDSVHSILIKERSKIVKDRDSLSKIYYDRLEREYVKFSELGNEITANIDTVRGSIKKSESLHTALKEVYRDTIKPSIDTVKDRIKTIEVISSTRYLFVERGDRKPSESQYRPVKLQLPYSDSFLTLVFYKCKRKPKKQAFIDVIITDAQKDTIEIRNFCGLEEHKRKFILEEKYSLEIIFIYLPPNPWGLILNTDEWPWRPGCAIPDYSLRKWVKSKSKVT